MRHAKPRRMHPIEHSDTMVWPRAALGLPIVDSNKGYDPGPFTLGWMETGDEACSRNGKMTGQLHDRLTSPLIIKPLSLRNGHFLPMALWLNRAYPKGCIVKLEEDGQTICKGSEAPFDTLTAPEEPKVFNEPSDPPSCGGCPGARAGFYRPGAAYAGSLVRQLSAE